MSSEQLAVGEKQKRQYWMRMGCSVKEGIRMHRISGQRDREGESRFRPWGNVTEHCLVEVARAETLGTWIGLSADLIGDIKTAGALHDYPKKDEITAIRDAEASGTSTVVAVREIHRNSNHMLEKAGFSNRVIKLANSQGGQASELLETKAILDKENLDPEDWAYLICHYVDDCSVGSDWVRPSHIDQTGKKINIIDYRAEENKAKPAYKKVSEEIGKQLEGSVFEGMNNHDAMAVVCHQIEQRLAQRILQKTGEVIDPIEIPELVDKKIETDITTIVG